MLELSRRRFLQSGAVALPWLNLAPLAAEPSRSLAGVGLINPSAIKSCIVLFYYGGPSHIDTWDLKPDAPAETRGEFRPIATSVPGLHVGEHLPRCALVANRLTIVRSMHHTMRNHNSAAAEALTGRTPTGGDGEFLGGGPNDFPSYGAALSKFAPVHGDVPTHVALPHVMYNVVTLPGQSAGFLGPAFNPLQVTSDPNDPAFRVDELQFREGMSPARLTSRQSLLTSMQSPLAESTMGVYQEKVFSLLRSNEVRRAFAIEQEPTAVRERYGRNKLGQSLLLARRLVEAGVRFINVNDKVRNSQLTNWDSHQNNAARLKDDLLPPADLGFSALIEDLDDRGLLDSTLVVAIGEFGRTPMINKSGGRDHWPDCFTTVLAGGGLPDGAVYGASDKIGAYPVSNPVTPGDLAATIFWRFGVNPELELRDMLGRPQKLASGRALMELFGGA